MNAIIGFSSLLVDNPDEDEEEREYFGKMIRNNGETLLTLINDILDISAIEADQLVIYNEPFSVDEILKELHSFYLLKNQKDIEIQLVSSSSESETVINSDPVRFRQIMNNLISNAIKFTEQGHVRFGYTKSDTTLEFFIEDTGIGIGEKDQQEIFNYFHKLEGNEHRLYEGTGIGLTISQRLAEMMGGKIYVKSEETKGSTFYFSLPADHRQVKLEKPVKNLKIKQTDLKDLVIIIAEDEDNNYNLIQRILGKTGARLLRAKNGNEAVELVSQTQPGTRCLVLMDIKMPGMNGIEANRIIKEKHPEIPVLAVTAYAQSGDKARLMKENFDDYIPKPLNLSLLLEKISRYYNFSN